MFGIAGMGMMPRSMAMLVIIAFSGVRILFAEHHFFDNDIAYGLFEGHFQHEFEIMFALIC